MSTPLSMRSFRSPPPSPRFFLIPQTQCGALLTWSIDETAVGMMATPMDKLMDMFKKFPDEGTPEPGAGKKMRGGSAEVVG